MTTMTEMTATEWLEQYGVTFDWNANGFHADADGWEHQRFTLTLRKSLGNPEHPELHTGVDITWRQGMLAEEDPTPESTLWAIANDVRAGEMSWEEFADEYGYDALEAPLSHYRTHYRTWEACGKLRADLYRFCGTGQMLEDFLNITEG